MELSRDRFCAYVNFARNLHALQDLQNVQGTLCFVKTAEKAYKLINDYETKHTIKFACYKSNRQFGNNTGKNSCVTLKLRVWMAFTVKCSSPYSILFSFRMLEILLCTVLQMLILILKFYMHNNSGNMETLAN